MSLERELSSYEHLTERELAVLPKDRTHMVAHNCL